MKKIITAIGNEALNNQLKKEKNMQVLINDIQYKEGIIEILEHYQDIDIILISDLLQGEISTTELVQKVLKAIPKIKIIIFLEKENKELENFLYSKGVYKIIYNNQIEIEELIKIINDENESNEDLKEEIRILKNIILENQQINNKKSKWDKLKNNINNKIKNREKNRIKNKQNKRNENKIDNNLILQQRKNTYDIKEKKTKIISITGPSGVGKSIISVNLAKSYIYSKNKILIIDFNVNNNSIHTILGVKKNPEKIKLNIHEKTIKINKKMDLLIFNKLNSVNDIEEINKLKSYYDILIIDLGSNNLEETIKNIINLSDINIFVSDTNLLEINKSIKLLDLFINKYKINKNKFNILFNKYNSNSIDINLLNKIFGEFNIIGYLKYNEKYNKLINRNSKNFLNCKKIRNEYIKLNNSINKK